MRRLFGTTLVAASCATLFVTACGGDEEDGGGGDGSKGGSSQGGGSGTSGQGGGGRGGAAGTNASGSSGASSTGGSGASSTGGSGASSTGGSGATATGGSGGSSGSSTGKSTAADVARKLGRAPNFLIGMGNDLAGEEHGYDHNFDGAYTLGVTMDLHYAYLVGLPGQGGWPDWNEGGTFVNILADSADANGTTPMYTVYSMAADDEGNPGVLTDAGYMGPYWEQVVLLFERLADFDKPAVVHLEPDFWAFMQQQSGGDAASMPVLIHDHVDGCDEQPENMVGLGHCIVKLSRMISPKVVIGFHSSRWAGDADETVDFLTQIGAAEADYVAIDMLDRDAGCFEEGVDPNCQRQDGPWYWDETNQRSPNFHEFLEYSKAIGDGLGKPIIWWQIPFGVPSETPGGSPGQYRDNRVRYIFSHIDEFIAAGGLGAAFGVGAGNQTYITSDGGQFQDAVTAYFATPVPLP